MGEVLPSGTYTIETDEEELDTVSVSAYRRVLTLIHVPPKFGNQRLIRLVTIDPRELDEALARDRPVEGRKNH